jgi:hypothetical protein
VQEIRHLPQVHLPEESHHRAVSVAEDGPELGELDIGESLVEQAEYLRDTAR